MAGEVKAGKVITEFTEKGADQVKAKMKGLKAEMKGYGTVAQESGKHARGFTGKLMQTEKGAASLTMRMKDLVAGGMLMSIGWQAINTVLTGTITAFNQLATASVEVEASMKAMEVVARSTGRNFADVMGIVNEHTDAFMTRTALMPGVLRLLSTSLSTEQIKKFIQAVKDGSTAMGYQATEQLPLIARGFKQLTANILDNIGVTIYLNRLRRAAAERLDVVADSLSEAQIHEELYNEMLQQTSKYQGLYNTQLETAKGAMARMGTEWVKLTEVMSKTEGIKASSDAVSNYIEHLRETVEMFQYVKEYGATPLERTMGSLAEAIASIPVIGGLLIPFMTSAADITDGLSGKVGLTSKAVAGEKRALDSIIPILGEYYKVTRKHNEAMGIFLQHTTKTEEELRELVEEYAKTSEEEERMMTVQESLSRSLGYVTTDMEEFKKEMVLATEEGSKLAEELAELETEQTSLQREFKVLTESVEKYEVVIRRENRLLRKNRNLLRDARDELRKWTSMQREAERAVSDLERSLERKMKVLHPEMFPPETEERLQDIQKEYERLYDQKLRAEERMSEATSVREYWEARAEGEELQAKLEELAKDELKTKKELGNEVESLQKKLEREKQSYAEITAQVNTLTASEEKHNKRVRELSDSIAINNEEMQDAKLRMDEIEERLKVLGEEGGLIETVTGKINDMTTAWTNAGNAAERAAAQFATAAAGQVRQGGFPTAPNWTNNPFAGSTDVSEGTIYNQQTYAIRIGSVNASTPQMQERFFKGLKTSIGYRTGAG